MLNLTQLKVLEAVARHGSVTEAAKELHYSQPSVSHHLGRLEAATGARLIRRVGYLVSDQPDQRLEDHRDSAWVGGCERCRAATITACERAGFTPRIAYSCDDTVVSQALVAAGMGVAILNGLALQAHRAPGIHATQLTGNARRIYAATYGDPPDPPATTALIEILASQPRVPNRDEAGGPTLVSRSSTSADRR
ncbi:LysR family transcriptional regulator [Streptomyces sp. NPDC048825]|uniref:LysR family transcriptional regulator n=1 Tax=Streptomyces sp. NPDC048825 TaxID=3365592 RepID=UPI0037117A2A